MLVVLRPRQQMGLVNSELIKSTDIEALSRFYLSVIHGMAHQARDDATSAELNALARMAIAVWPRDSR